MALFGGDFLQLVPGFLSPEYDKWMTDLQQFVDLMTYEGLDPQTFYQMVGFGAVTLPETRQGMLMRELIIERSCKASLFPRYCCMDETISWLCLLLRTMSLATFHMPRVLSMITVDMLLF